MQIISRLLEEQKVTKEGLLEDLKQMPSIFF